MKSPECHTNLYTIYAALPLSFLDSYIFFDMGVRFLNHAAVYQMILILEF